MDTPQAQAETTPASAAPETGADVSQPNLESGSLEDLDAVQTQAAKVVAESKTADSPDGQVTEETAATTTEEPVKTEAIAETTTEETPPEETAQPEPTEPTTEEPGGEIPERFRFKDPTDRAIAAVKKAADINGTPISWTEAEKRVRGEPAAEKPVLQSDPVAELANQQETLKGEIAALEAQIDPENEEEILSTKESRAATVKLAEKRAELVRTEMRLENAQAAVEMNRQDAEQAQRQAREDSKNRAFKAYPDASKKGTPLNNAIAKRFQEMKDPRHPDHPILYADTAPERVAQIVADELGIQAVKPGKTVQPTTTTQQAKPQAKAAPASGAKTAVPGKPAEKKDDKGSVEYLRSDKASLEELDRAFGADKGIVTAVR